MTTIPKPAIYLGIAAFITLLMIYIASNSPSFTIKIETKPSESYSSFSKTQAIIASKFACEPQQINHDLPKKFEPSDVVWDRTKQVMYVVDDNGRIVSLDENGNLKNQWDVNKAMARNKSFKGLKWDLEGVAFNPNKPDLLYLGLEYPASIIEFNLLSSQIVGIYRVQDIFDHNPTSDPSHNSGLESLAFIPSSASKYGGYFYAGRQTDAQIFVVELEPKSQRAIYHGWIKPPGPGFDLSAMTVFKDHLFMLYDKAKELTSVDILANELIPKNKPLRVDFTIIQPKTQFGTAKFTVRGFEGISFIDDKVGTPKYVVIGVDPPKKGMKTLIRYEFKQFLKCFSPPI
ncbi:hypothetical protein HK098_001558 [Nowakowskiella sp. JEL0407]|nr:hypothetical protein HK098_001558 [Nowakowskiella sp. JEL0407]